MNLREALCAIPLGGRKPIRGEESEEGSIEIGPRSAEIFQGVKKIGIRIAYISEMIFQ